MLLLLFLEFAVMVMITLVALFLSFFLSLFLSFFHSGARYSFASPASIFCAHSSQFYRSLTTDYARYGKRGSFLTFVFQTKDMLLIYTIKSIFNKFFIDKNRFHSFKSIPEVDGTRLINHTYPCPAAGDQCSLV